MEAFDPAAPVRKMPLFDDRRIAKDRRKLWAHKLLQEYHGPERRVECRRMDDAIPLVEILGVSATGGVWL